MKTAVLKLIKYSKPNPLNPKTMTHETKTKLKAAVATGYIVLTACLGLAFFGRFVLAIITL